MGHTLLAGLTFALTLTFAAVGAPRASTIELNSVIDPAQSGGGARMGSGSGSFTLDTVAETLTFDISFSGLSAPEAASHIHGPALPGVGAAILYSLPLGSPKQDIIALVDLQAGAYTVAEQIDDLLNDLWYVNIHSDAFLAGEIRGQIVPEPAALLFLATATVALALRTRRTAAR